MHFPRLGTDEINITPIEKGGSDRKFYRIRCSPDQTIILVKYNLEREENRHYVRIAEFLTEHEIGAPKIYFHDAAEGLIWIEDLGERDLFAFRNDPWMVRRVFYESALDEVRKLHRLPAEVCEAVKESLPAEFNAELYLWEQHYFFENCLGRYFRLGQEKIDQLAALPALADTAARLSRRPRNLVHRDFQSQNIIVRNNRAYLIDFQGMRPGLAEYDLASLLYDPYVELSEAERAELIEHYCQGKASKDFKETLDLCAMQRLMQALGAYGFLGLVKRNEGFLQYIPKALGSLREVVGRIGHLEALASVLGQLA